MFNFLRKIRQKLLAAGSIQRYLAYAIGEILLVMIGILLALQVNTWNQNRLNAKEEQRLLRAISEKMQFNRFQHGTGTNRYKEVIAAAERLLTTMNNASSKLPRDQIDQDLYALSKRFLMGKTNSTHIYDELIGAGQLGLLTSIDLRERLTTLKVHMELLDSYEELQNRYVDYQLSPFLNRHVDQLSVSANGLKMDSSFYDKLLAIDYSAFNSGHFASSYDELLKSREFSNLLIELIKHTKTLLPIYSRIGILIADIDSIAIAGNLSIQVESWKGVD